MPEFDLAGLDSLTCVGIQCEDKRVRCRAWPYRFRSFQPDRCRRRRRDAAPPHALEINQSVRHTCALWSHELASMPRPGCNKESLMEA